MTPSSVCACHPQNRNAQRAFRERKERVLKDLEDKISGLNKINEEQMNENQSECRLTQRRQRCACSPSELCLPDLKELVTRLQEENRRLQSSSTSSSTSSAPESDFTFRLPSSSTPQESSLARTSSGPASFSDADIMAFLNQPSTAPKSQQPFTMIPPSNLPPLGDDWLWNSSSFGTEIPQAIPPSVNFLDQYAANASALAAGSTHPYTQSATVGQPSVSEMDSSNGPHQDPASAYHAVFSSFSPTGFAAYPGISANDSGFATFASSSGSGKPTKPAISGTTYKASGVGDSPDTTYSSSSGSDPSDQPVTPSVPSMPATNMFGTKDAGGEVTAPNYFSTTAGTPGNLFNLMDYRDPIFFADLGAQDGFPGQETTTSEALDFSDFLVQSPPTLGGFDPGCPIVATAGGSGASGNSGSSVPALASSASTVSSGPSSPHSAAVVLATEPDDYLPYDVPYSHPLIKHVLRDFPKPAIPPSVEPSEIDCLCDGMKMKVSCKEVSAVHQFHCPCLLTSAMWSLTWGASL